MTSASRFSRNALRVAVVTTIAVAGLMLVLCVSVDLVVVHTLRSSAATRLTTELGQLTRSRGGLAVDEPDLDDPFLVWQVDGSGSVISSSTGAPSLPVSARHVTSPIEMSIAGNDVLVAGSAFAGGRLVGAVSLAGESSSATTLLITEAIVAPILLALVFGGAVLVGRNAASPIELARRRQLEFTADASHELRTPLAVIEAETSLALGKIGRAHV
jgi:signal transduction histidine kinase